MALDGMKVRRTRPRSQSFKFDRAKIFDRVKDFYEKDRESRDLDLEQRLQRYAKYRMWTSGSSGVWDGASDIPLPDMTEVPAAAGHAAQRGDVAAPGDQREGRGAVEHGQGADH